LSPRIPWQKSSSRLSHESSFRGINGMTLNRFNEQQSTIRK
jgi:hypothetical protein